MRELQILDEYLLLWEKFIEFFSEYFRLQGLKKIPGVDIQNIPGSALTYEAVKKLQDLQLRKILLTRPQDLLDYDTQQFTKLFHDLYLDKVGLTADHQQRTIVSQILDSVVDVLKWFLCSKKVYALSENMFSLLAATDILDFQFADIVFPFQAFLIKLPYEVHVKSGQISVTHVFCQNYMHEMPRCRIVLLGPSISGKIATLPFAEKKFEKASKNKDPRPYFRYLGEWIDDINLPMVDLGFAQNVQLQRLYDEIAADDVPIAELFLLPMKVALYLMSLGPKDTETVQVKKGEEHFMIKGAAVKKISTDIFHLDTTYTVQAYGGANGERATVPRWTLDPSFRRGYFRRMPGRGNDPHAPKVVRVRPTMINKHLLETKNPLSSMGEIL